MTKVLLISYHALPMDVISSYRTQGYLDHFSSSNIRPTLVSHYWDNKNHNNPSYTSFKNFDEIRLPIKKSLLGNTTRWISNIPFLSKPFTLLLNILGVFDFHTIDSYYSIKKYLYKHLAVNKYDFILSIFSPQYQVKLPYLLNKKFKIPFSVDFRDLWNNSVINRGYNPSFKEKIIDYLVLYYWKKWLKKASFYSITSKTWLSFLEINRINRGIVITNGYTKLLEPKKNKLPALQIHHIGSLYNNQDLVLLLEGIKLFLKNSRYEINLTFVGSLRKGSQSPSGFHQNPEKLIRSFLKETDVRFKSRVSKSEALKIMENTDVLLFPSFPKQPGTYTGKLFDYIASGKNILMFPNDFSVCDELVKNCECGYIANTPKEIENFIIDKCKEKESNGFLNYYGNKKEIAFYSRKHQAKLLAQKINQVICS